MNKHISKISFLVPYSILLISCKQAYQPAVTTVNSNLLVVEGLINTGNDSTIVNLNRTVTIAQKQSIKPEVGATIMIESDTDDKYSLSEQSPGKYATPILNLNSNKKYRLNIRTKNGSRYLSTFVSTATTPPIDSISWEAKKNGVQIYANTHNPQNNTRYYRWSYEETWAFHPMFYSAYLSNGKDVIERDMATQNVYDCWQSYYSSTITLGSSSKLEEDVIHLNPLTFIASDSEKISVKYSILVKQYALTKEAFSFWERLKKNTESLGSIFDAQPSQLTGNIHNVSNPEELVLGYISAGDVKRARIFISKENLPNWATTYPYACVEPDTVLVYNGETKQREEDIFFHSQTPYTLIPIAAVYAPGTSYIIGHTGAKKECSDCTIRGVNRKPDFWQ